MLKTFCSILLLASNFSSLAQKTLEKTIDASGIERLVIDADAVFIVSIISEKTTEISIRTKVAGETYENVLVTTSEANKTLTIGTSYSPYFKANNDKLAAHKVLSIEMQLIVPEFLDISINSEIASVKAKGVYNMLQIALDRGGCELTEFRGNASLQTKQGDIDVYAIGNIAGKGISKYGIVRSTLPLEGKHRIIAESRDGDVSLFQTK